MDHRPRYTEAQRKQMLRDALNELPSDKTADEIEVYVERLHASFEEIGKRLSNP